MPAPLAPEILPWVQHGPAGCGLDRANWTYSELAAHLYRIQGIMVSESTMRTFGTNHGVRPYRPISRDLTADPAQQAAAQQDLQACKKKAERGELVLMSQDEARFSMIP
jgi:hypothetical protein